MNVSVTDWYWVVAESTTQVWSSKRTAYVALNDADYTAWVAAGNTATEIKSVADLGGVMLTQWLPRILAQGITLSSTANAALNGSYTLDPDRGPHLPGLTAITSVSTSIAAGKGLLGGGSTFNYDDVRGNSHAFDATSFQNFAAAVETYVYSLGQAVALLVGGNTATIPATTLTIP